jgi:hypothetical protein
MLMTASPVTTAKYYRMSARMFNHADNGAMKSEFHRMSGGASRPVPRKKTNPAMSAEEQSLRARLRHEESCMMMISPR